MKVLIVDDDLALADVISFTMRRAGFEVLLAYDGQMALERWKAEEPDLILLDLNLPKLDGLKVCQAVRAQSDVPIIILSVRDDEEDVVAGLKIGADDYIIKPFSPRQVIARVEAVMRRVRQVPVQIGLLRVGDLMLDSSRNELWRGESVLAQLTRLECRLLEVLIRHRGHVVTTDMLIDSVWGPAGGDRGMLKQLMYRLRRKIEDDPSNPTYLDTISGIGYSLRVDDEPSRELNSSERV